MWDNLQSERWFERAADVSGGALPPDAPASRLQRHLAEWEVRGPPSSKIVDPCREHCRLPKGLCRCFSFASLPLVVPMQHEGIHVQEEHTAPLARRAADVMLGPPSEAGRREICTRK